MQNNLMFNQLYQDNFRKIYKFVRNNSGKMEDAEDLFQDAMLVLVEKLRSDDFKLTASANTYLYAICKNLWFKKLRDQNYQVSIDKIKEVDFQESINYSIESEMSYLEKLKSYLTKITEHCHRLINDIFFNNKSIETIQSEYNYSSKHNAQNQKHKCVKQLKDVSESEKVTSAMLS